MEHVITDEFLQKLRHKNSTIRIEGKLYKVSNNENIELGDLVLDRKDGLVGYINHIFEDFRYAVSHQGVAELGVPIERLVKLEPKYPEGEDDV